jgi:starvation-inducible DNA-binding protein
MGERAFEISTREDAAMSDKSAMEGRVARLDTPNGSGNRGRERRSAALDVLLADVFSLYLKSKYFHWHVSGAHFRDYHLLLDEHAAQIYAATDALAERVRKLGATTLRSIGHTFHGCSGYWTTTRSTSRRSICWLSCAMTTIRVRRVI